MEAPAPGRPDSGWGFHCNGGLLIPVRRAKGTAMTAQNHESLKTLISGLSITRYQGLLKTKLDETERQEIQTLLQEEKLSLKRLALKAN